MVELAEFWQHFAHCCLKFKLHRKFVDQGNNWPMCSLKMCFFILCFVSRWIDATWEQQMLGEKNAINQPLSVWV